MNDACCNKKYLAYGAAILGCFLIMAALVKIMEQRAATASGQQRAEERRKNYQTAQAEARQAIENYGWQNKAKGTIRLPVDRAMELTLQELQNPAAARSNLLVRLEKANAPEPKAPEKPSEFE